jgi:hypothetical protein
MAAGAVITVLTNIPWGTVIETAPKVAEAASKLWKTVVNRPKPDTPPSESDLLKSRVMILEDDVKNLQEQMQASSELIKDLAEQNTQLVLRIEKNRTHLVRLMIATTIGGTLLLTVIIYIFFAGRI